MSEDFAFYLIGKEDAILRYLIDRDLKKKEER